MISVALLVLPGLGLALSKCKLSRSSLGNTSGLLSGAHLGPFIN